MFVNLEDVFGAPLNEAVDRKDIFKAFAATTMLEVGRGSKLSRGYSGVVELDGYAIASVKYGWFKRGNAYGDFEVLSVTPANQQDFNALVRYGEKKYNLYLKNTGLSRLSASAAKKLADYVLEQAADRQAASAAKFSTVGDYLVIDVDSKAYSELKSVKLGATFGKRFGDIIVTDKSKRPSGISEGDPFVMEAVSEDGITELVFRNADKLSNLNESLRNEVDFANTIMRKLGIKGKQIGHTNVFEVSGRDRMKIDKLKANDELGDVIIFNVEDDNYSTNLEVKTYLMPKCLTIKFTDEAEMFESEMSEAFKYTGEKEFNQAFTKATGFKTKSGGYYNPASGSAEVKIDLYDCVEYNKHLPRVGKYGDLEIKSVAPMNEYEQAEMVVVYQGVDIECGVSASYPKSAPKASNNTNIDLIFKAANIKADYEVTIKDYQPSIKLDTENFNKIKKIKIGDKIGDFIVCDTGVNYDRRASDNHYIVMTSRKVQFSIEIFREDGMNESDNLPVWSREAALNESAETELNEVTGLPKHKTIVPSHML